MTDDELIDKVRNTLHNHAGSVAAPHDAWERFEQRADHNMTPGSATIHRPLWLPVSLGTVVAVAAAVALFMVLRSPAHRTSLKAVSPSVPTSVPAALPTTSTSRPPATTSPTTNQAIVVAPPSFPPGGAVPKGFSPISVTFVSINTGWVLGTSPCPSGPCISLLRTTDAGKTWASIPAPPAPVSQFGSLGVNEVRFGSAQDGWVFGSQLWATHDGGAHWRRIGINSSSPRAVMDLESAADVVHAAILTDTGPIRILTSPVNRDNWVASPTTVAIGGGPVPTAQIVLQGTAGWLMQVDRVVSGGARLDHGRWVPWQPPCMGGGSWATLTASTPTDLVAVCANIWGGTSPPQSMAYVSTDGGLTFHATGTPAPVNSGQGPVASASPGTIVIGGSALSSTYDTVLVASFNNGATWTAVNHSGGAATWGDIGFTSPTQGVAVLVASTRGKPGGLLMTTDAGHSWKQVGF